MIKVELDNKDVKTVQKTIGGGSSLYTYYVIAMDDNNYEYSFTFQCDNPKLDSYDKLAQHLLSKGYYLHSREGKDSYCPTLSVVSYYTNSWGVANGLFVNNTLLSDGQLLIVLSILCISSGSLYTNNISLTSDNFEIILVTE